MEKQVVVIGLGRFGVSLATSLSKMGHDVLALDIDENKVQSVAAQITRAIHADATDETVLDELGVKNFDVAVVAIGSDIQNSVLSAVLLKRLGIPYVIARADSKAHAEILSKIGVDKVVSPEYRTAERLAHEIRLGNVSDYLPLAPGYGITSIQSPPEFAGRTLADIGFGPKGKESIAVLLIQRGKEVVISPSMSEVVEPGDVLIVAGSDDKVEDFLTRTMKGRRT